MKPFMLFAALAVSSTATAEVKSFDFLGFNTESVTPSITQLAGKKCKVAQEGLSSCNIYAGVILGNARVLDLTVSLNNAHMISVSGYIFPTFYTDLSDAFEAKYGSPSTIEVRKWQNQAGAVFDNTVKVWHFSNGTLELR